MRNPIDRTIKTVYLAGPITGLSYDEARLGWREAFTKMLPNHIEVLSPMRGKNYLMGETTLVGGPDMYPQHVMSAPKGIVTRDRYDVITSDAMVANFLGATVASIGTAIEFGWADLSRKPIIMICDEKNLHWHAMLCEIAGYVVPTLEDGAQLLIHLLTPGI